MSNASSELKKADISAAYLKRPLPWNWFEALALGFLALVGMDVILSVVLGILASAATQLSIPTLQTWVNQLQNQNVVASFIFYGLSRLLGFWLIASFVRRRGVGLKHFGFSRFKLGAAIGRVLIAVVSLIVISSLVFYVAERVMPSLNINQVQDIVFTQAQGGLQVVLAFMALVVIAPIVEESIFRGFLLPAFSRRFSIIFGVLVTSILFGLVHGQLNVAIITFVMGLLLAWLYAKSQSLVPAIMFHSLKNLVAFLLIFH